MAKTPRQWTLRTASESFENLFDLAISDGAQQITNGKESVVVLHADDYRQLKAAERKKQNLVQFFAESPLVNSGIDLSRSKDR